MNNITTLGDRWVIHSILPNLLTQKIPISASWNLLLSDNTEILFECTSGKMQTARYCSKEEALILQEGFTWSPSPIFHSTYLLLTNKNPFTFRFVAEPMQPQQLDQSHTEHGIEIAFHDDLPTVYTPPVSWELFTLSKEAALFALTPDFEKLMGLSLLRDVDLYDHQIKTVKTVLQRFRGRGLLCDEVGLGKTVEACLILLELIVRKLVRRTLVLTPPSLVSQWQGELQRKFGLQFAAYDDENFKKFGEQAWKLHDHIIASYHTAKLEPYRSWIAREQWDIVIFDEAHHLRNNKTVLWKFASSLQKKYILLLTATPMQNHLEDLYNLVTLLKPGLLNTAKNFKKQFISKNSSNKNNDFEVKNIDKLHNLVAECMVRNRRATISVNFTKRFARTFRVTPSAEEEILYREVTEFVKMRLKEKKPFLSRMSLLSLQKLMGSFPKGIAPLLNHMLTTKRVVEKDEEQLLALIEKTEQLNGCMKVKRLLSLLEEYPEKLVIFTQFRVTQEHLYKSLEVSGYSTALFHGSLTRMQKEEAIRSFREEKRVLISTDSGSEGRNLQFCNAICNFDLPWNPMRIEQRIGRISRLGQTRDVHIFNLVNANTIEDDVLRILEMKINLFEQVIGEMDMIVGNLEDDREFEDTIIDLWIQSDDMQQFSGEIEKFGDRLMDAKKEYLLQQAREDKLFGDKLMAKA
ncbi:MAG: SNF2-related protein [Waddliaceae bacterium]